MTIKSSIEVSKGIEDANSSITKTGAINNNKPRIKNPIIPAR